MSLPCLTRAGSEREVLNQSYQGKVDSVERKEHAVRISRTALKNIRNEYQARTLASAPGERR